jgi:hypothetical protein
MRRPSREGLIRACTFYNTVWIKAMPALKRKEKPLSSTEFLLNPPFDGTTVTQRPDSKNWSSIAYRMWSCVIKLTLRNSEKHSAEELSQPDPSIEKAHKVSCQTRIPGMILFFILASIMFTPHAHAQDIKQETEEYFREIRRGNFPATPGSLILPENENMILYLMGHYLHDTVYAVRAKAHEIAYLVASHSTNTHIRNQGVEILTTACAQPALGMTAILLDLLKQFEKKDFSIAAKDTLRMLVKAHAPHVDQFMKLAAFLDLKDLIPVIRPSTQPGNPIGTRWAAYLSLSRMGEKSATAEILRRIKKIPLNDDVVYEVFPDLIYTRQPEALTHVIEALYSDEKNCMAADAEKDAPTVCGYRIMEQLAPVIIDYPLQLDEFGDLQTNDYPAALEHVREWFLKHKTYTIRNDKY